MTQAQTGHTVKVHYTGTLDDGTQFDSSVGSEPLQVTLGNGEVIPGFEKGIEGMRVGEKKQVHIPSEDAYGESHEALVQEVGMDQMPPDIEPDVGQQFQVEGPSGPMILTVTALSDDSVTMDGNHPMAGKNLNFELELVEIVS